MKKYLALLLSVLMVLALASCGASSGDQASTGSSGTSSTTTTTTTSDETDKPNIVFCNCGAIYPYPAAAAMNFEKMCEEKGWEYTVLDGNADATLMCKNIEQAITMDPDVIVVMPVDNVMEAESVKLAYEAGIPVVFDTGRPADGYEQYGNCYNGVDDVMAGQVAARMMDELLGGQGKIVKVTGIPGQLTTEDRNTGFAQEMESRGSKIEIIGENSGEWSKETAYQVMSDFLTRFGDEIDGVWAHDDEQAAGAAQAIQDAGYDLDDFVVIGVGGSATGLQYIDDGLLDGTTYQSPSATMSLTIEAVEYILENDLKAGEALDPYWRWIELPAVTAANVDEFLPGEW